MVDEQTLEFTMKVTTTEAEGPGNRYAIWLQKSLTLEDQRIGVNEEAVLPNITKLTLEDVISDIMSVRSEIEGLTFRGEDPFDQALILAELARLMKQLNLSIMVFTKFTLQELKSQAAENKGVRLLLLHTDLLVAGRPLSQLPDTNRRWIESSNQELHFLTTFYQEGDPRFRDTGHAEIRLTHSKEATLHLSINGHSQYNLVTGQKILGKRIPLHIKQLSGKQWLEDIFQRDIPTGNSQLTWDKNENFWALALEKARLRSVKWLLDQPYSQKFPRLINGQVQLLHLLDIDLTPYPLKFGPISEVLLGGIDTWRSALKEWISQIQNEENGQVENFRKTTFLNTESITTERTIFIGDWILLASLFNKFSRPKAISWICKELLDIEHSLKDRRNTKKFKLARKQILDWFILNSPICALLTPRLGVQTILKKPDSYWTKEIILYFDIISPKLHTLWSSSASIERTKDGFISADSWSHLQSIYKLSYWAAEHQMLGLGTACLNTFGDLLNKTAPENYFQTTAETMEKLSHYRKERLNLLSIYEPWQKQINIAQSMLYGDENYMTSQLVLKHAERWQISIQKLKEFQTFGKGLISSVES